MSLIQTAPNSMPSSRVALTTAEPTILTASGVSLVDERRSAIVLRRRSSVTKWYHTLDPDNDDSSIAEEAYKEGVSFCKKELGGDIKGRKMWLEDHNSIQDVLTVVNNAQKAYDVRRASGSNMKSKASRMLNIFSSRVMYYSNVLDVMVQHHPEYVSLAWGAIKFLFVMTINHEELVIQIASAFSEIGDILSQVEISAKLYPTKMMKDAVENLYAQILKFCVKATKWFKRSKLMHALTAITKPYALEFKDVVAQIEFYSQKIRHLANTSSRAEIRDLHISVRHIEKTVALLALGDDAIRLRPDFTTRQSVNPMNTPLLLENILPYLTSSISMPEDNLRIGSIMRDRRRARGSSSGSSSIWFSKILQQWASEPKSSLLQISGSVLTKNDGKDFALDIVTLARSTKMPVIWSLSTGMVGRSTQITANDILKSLIQQVIGQHKDVFTGSSSLSQECFHHCLTTNDWLKLFIAVLSEIPRILIVLDADENLATGMSELGQYWKELVKENIRTIVKLVIVVYDVKPGSLRYSSDRESNCYNISLDQGRRPGMGRKMSPAAGKALRRSRATHGNSVESLRPFLLRMTTSEQQSPE